MKKTLYGYTDNNGDSWLFPTEKDARYNLDHGFHFPKHGANVESYTIETDNYVAYNGDFAHSTEYYRRQAYAGIISGRHDSILYAIKFHD